MQKNLHRLYLHHLLFTFAESINIVFLPVYLYKLTDSIASAFFLYAGFWALGFTLIVPCFNFSIARGHPRLGLIFGMIFYSLSLFALSAKELLGESCYLLWIIFFALYLATYWYPRHWTISQMISSEKVGSQMSSFIQISVLAGVIGPIVGGFIAHKSIESSMRLGGVCLLVSIIPLLWFTPPVVKERIEWRSLISTLRTPIYRKLRPIFVGEAWLWHLFGTNWALAFALYVGSLKEFGMIISFASLVAAVGARLVGRLFDGARRKQALLTTTYSRMFITAAYSLLSVSPSLAVVASLESAMRVASALQASVNDAYVQSIGKKLSPLYFHANRELTLIVTRVLICSGLGIWFSYHGAETLWAIIPIGALGLLPSLTYSKVDFHLGEPHGRTHEKG